MNDREGEQGKANGRRTQRLQARKLKSNGDSFEVAGEF